MLEFTKDSFDDLEIYKDLYPYDYYTTKENLCESLFQEQKTVLLRLL